MSAWLGSLISIIDHDIKYVFYKYIFKVLGYIIIIVVVVVSDAVRVQALLE